MTVCTLTIIIPSTTLTGNTPYEIWYDNALIILFLRPLTMLLSLIKVRKKQNLELKKQVFLGYLEGVNGYRLWERSQKGVRIIITRYVTFNEFEMPCMKREEQQNSQELQSTMGEEMSLIKIKLEIQFLDLMINSWQDANRSIRLKRELLKVSS